MSSAADSKSDSDSAARILLIGAPGSGKRTQAQRIQEKYGVCNVGLGALFWNQAIKCSRSKAQREGFFPQESDANGLSQTKFSPREKEFCSVLKEGGKFSDELIVDLICERLESEACLSKGYVLHDVPRNIEQSVWLKRKLMAKEISPKNVIHLDTSGWGDQELDFLKDRLKGRLIHPTSGRSYHMESAPPLEALKDNVTGRKLVRFKEDLDEENKAIEENFRNYAKEFPPIWNHLNKEFEKELSKVDGTQRIEDVFRFIEHILDSN